MRNRYLLYNSKRYEHEDRPVVDTMNGYTDSGISCFTENIGDDDERRRCHDDHIQTEGQVKCCP